MKTAVVDMDGVICEEKPTFERMLARPIPGAAAGIMRLRHAGYQIVIHTARGWGEYAATKEWLRRNDIYHDLLLCGKPIADVVIDDRAIRFKGWEGVADAIG